MLDDDLQRHESEKNQINQMVRGFSGDDYDCILHAREAGRGEKLWAHAENGKKRFAHPEGDIFQMRLSLALSPRSVRRRWNPICLLEKRREEEGNNRLSDPRWEKSEDRRGRRVGDVCA